MEVEVRGPERGSGIGIFEGRADRHNGVRKSETVQDPLGRPLIHSLVVYKRVCEIHGSFDIIKGGDCERDHIVSINTRSPWA